jgi:nitrogen fixation-related uncharacterized protein
LVLLVIVLLFLMACKSTQFTNDKQAFRRLVV